jgi:uncharacterized protein (TIGR02265 family)
MPRAAEDIVFDNTVEALFHRAVGKRLTPRCRKRLAEAGIDLSAPLRPTYPRTTFYRGVFIVTEELFPGVPRDQALFELGGIFFNGFVETLIGKAAISVMKVLGPRRTLGRMTQNFRSSNNYMETRLEERSPSHAELWLSQCSGAPTYFQGVIHRALTIIGARGLEIRVKEVEGSSCVLDISWKP